MLQLNYGYVNASEPNLWRARYDIVYTVSDDPFETPPPSFTQINAIYSLLYAFRDWLENYVKTRSMSVNSLRNEYNDTLNNYNRLLAQCIALGNTESVCRAQLDSYLEERRVKIEKTESVLSKVKEDINRLEEFMKALTPPPYQPPPPPPQPVYAGATPPEAVLPPEVLEALRQPPPPTTEEVVRQFLQKMGILREEKPPEEEEKEKPPPEEEKPPEERPAPTPAPAKPTPLGLLALLALLLSESK